MFSTELVVQTLISGVMIGVLYALMALGITFIYSIMRMINWAMGEFYMIGSYLQYMLVCLLLGPDLWWLAAILISTAGVFVLGCLHRADPDQADLHARAHGAARRLRDRRHHRAAADAAQPRDRRSAVPTSSRPSSNLPIVMVGPAAAGGARVAAFVVRAGGARAVLAAARSTWYGLALRAASQSRVGVQTAGIDVLPARRDRVRHRRGARRPRRRAAGAGVPGVSDQRRGHDGEGLRDRRDRRARLDPGRADRRRAARPGRNRSARPSSIRPTRTSTASCWCCSCCWCGRTACSASAGGEA